MKPANVSSLMRAAVAGMLVCACLAFAPDGADFVAPDAAASVGFSVHVPWCMTKASRSTARVVSLVSRAGFRGIVASAPGIIV
jgi:hypothetical protein